MSSNAKGRIEDLSEIELNSSSAVEEYTTRIRDLCADLAVELLWGAAELQRRLEALPMRDGSVLPTAQAKARARRITRHVKAAADAINYAGGQSVSAWSKFNIHILRDLAHDKKPPIFDVDA